MLQSYDIIIIGSGAGGATAAELLSQKPGLKILLLESGPYRTKDHFNQKEKDMTAIYYKRGGFLSSDLSIGVAAANTVGGSTAVYTGVSFRPPESVLDKWRTQHGLHFLTPEYVNQSLDHIEQELNVHELPESWDNDNNRLFKEGAQKLGIPVKRLKINIKGCQQQGFCNLGCTSGGKQSTLEVQIPKALKNGVELIHNADVQIIEKNKVSFTIKPAPQNTIKNSIPEGQYTIHAQVIVVAAGVLQTPALLWRSKNYLNLNTKLLGRYVTLHPAININGIYKEVIKNYRGFPKTYYSDAFSDSHGYYLETSFYYPGITAKNNPGFGEVHQNLMSDYEKMMSILILAHDHAEYQNHISIDKKGNSVLHYTISKEVKKSLIHALKKSLEIFFAAGCTHASSPGSSKSLIKAEDISKLNTIITDQNLSFAKTPLSSAHPQGGCIMGKTPEQSMVNLKGQIWGTNHIYVADASLFPTSVKVNPYETVMLLSKYVSEQILKTHFA